MFVLQCSQELFKQQQVIYRTLTQLFAYACRISTAELLELPLHIHKNVARGDTAR